MIIRSTNVSPVIIVSGVVLIVLASAILLVISKFQPTTPLYLGDGVFDARIAYTEGDREKGFGGADKITDKQALVLAFASDDKWQIWMKNMNVPIDIIWLNNEKRVVHIVRNALPDEGEKAIFIPKSDARYVVELAAGMADSNTIKVGRTAIFDVNEEDIK